MFTKMNMGYLLVLVYILKDSGVICRVNSVMETRLKYCHSRSVPMYNILCIGMRLHSGNIDANISPYRKLKYGKSYLI